MICYNSIRPFSLDQKLDNLDKYLPSYSKVVEVRLFAVTKTSRNGVIAYRLLKHCINLLLEQGFDLALISGTVQKLKFFRKIGLVPFGPTVGDLPPILGPLVMLHIWRLYSTKYLAFC